MLIIIEKLHKLSKIAYKMFNLARFSDFQYYMWYERQLLGMRTIRIWIYVSVKGMQTAQRISRFSDWRKIESIIGISKNAIVDDAKG